MVGLDDPEVFSGWNLDLYVLSVVFGFSCLFKFNLAFHLLQEPGKLMPCYCFVLLLGQGCHRDK